jgi:chromosome partitioning protein
VSVGVLGFLAGFEHHNAEHPIPILGPLHGCEDAIGGAEGAERAELPYELRGGKAGLHTLSITCPQKKSLNAWESAALHSFDRTGMHMYTIAIVGQKGGTGKTTVAQNLGVAATRGKQSVAIVDLDAQTSATNWGDRRASESPTVVSCQVARLRFVLEEARAKGVAWALLDTPGKNAEASIEAAKSANLVLVPVQPLINDIETLPALRDLLRVAGEKPAVVIVNNAPTRGDRHVHAQETARELGFVICPVVLYHRVALHDGPLSGLGAQEYEPNGKAAQEIAQLYKFIKTLLHDHTGEQHGKTKAKTE